MNSPLFSKLYAASFALGMLGVGCTDLSLQGDEQLRCRSNAECPAGLQCAPALQLCVAEAVAAELPITLVGAVELDVDRVSRVEGFARSTIDVVFSKVPVAASALFDNRIAVPCSAAAEDAKALRCTFDARDVPDDADGGYDIVVVGVDAAGNEARGRVRLELDTLPPGVAPASIDVRYEPTTPSLVREPAALGPATRALVQFTLTEVADDVTLQLVDDAGATLTELVRDAQRSAGLLQVFVLDGDDVPDGSHALVVSAVDALGNSNRVVLDAVLVVDASAPAVADVQTDGAIVFQRSPWGTRAEPTPTFTLRGGANAVEAHGLVVVTAGAALSSSLLATVQADSDGSFVTALQPLDVPRVFVRVVDHAGNVGAAVAVRNIEWTASLGGRIRSDDFSNPHALFTTGAFDLVGVEPNLQTEPLRPGDLVDGAGFTVTALPRRIEVRTQATGQPTRMAGAMGYLPAAKVAVIFGGVAERGRAQLTETLVRRNGRWQAIAVNPPAQGPLVYDSVHEELVSLLSNGDLWAFDGTTWRQRPVERHPAMDDGPLAFDPLSERFVTVQGTTTWSLGLADSIWTQLADAPIRGVHTFDGLNTIPGGVIAFDGVDGWVLLYGGGDGSDDGGVYALIDDSWAPLGAAPAMRLATAVEDPFSGRVHFVCRTTPSGNDGAILTWDGSAMQRGPVDPEARTGCGGVVDIAEQTLLAHGGTFDSQVDTGALPSGVINVLDVGAVVGESWRAISSAEPTSVLHNSAGGPSQAGTAHYNPLLQQMVFHAAFTGALSSRATTLWRNEAGVSAGSLFGLRPFFDGIASRLVDGGSERVLSNGAWTSRALPFVAPAEAFFVYDEAADAAIGFGGFRNGSQTNDTYRLRGDAFTVLSPTTRPPARSAPAIAYDAAHARVVIAGGHANLFQPLGDAWAFEGGDWHQLPDLPQGGGGGDVQLLFDRGRNVLVAFVLGELFDLRDDTWVPVDVDVAPRADALALYDETSQRLLFVGGLNFERVLSTIDAYDLANTRAGVLARFDIRAAGASPAAEFAAIDIDVVAGASGDTDGVTAIVWGSTSFVQLARNDAGATTPAALQLEETASTLAGALRDTLIVGVHSAPSATGPAPAQLRLEQLELTLRYREP